MRRMLLVLLAVATVAAIGCSDGDSDDATATAGADDGNGGASSSATGPGISVVDALASTLGDPLLVNGFLVVTGDEARLCEALAESFPPQCGGASLLVEGPDPAALAGLETEGNVSWTAQPIQLLGEVEDGTLRVDGLSTG